MGGHSSVVADPAAGAALVAGTRIAMSPAGAAGALRFGGAHGSVLRPLSFGERTELVSLASTTDAVAAGILTAATIERGDGATTLLEVLAMWLAGAEHEAPDFMQTTLLVARAAGWPPADLFAAPAREIDRLAVHLSESSEWNSLVLAEAPAETVDAVRERFAARLLARSSARAETPAQDEWNVGHDSTSRPVLVAGTSRGGERAEASPRINARSEGSTRDAVPLAKGVRLLVPSTTAEAQPSAAWAAAAEPPRSQAWQQTERQIDGRRDGSQDVANTASPRANARWDEQRAERCGGLQPLASESRRRDVIAPAGADTGIPRLYVASNEHAAERGDGFPMATSTSRQRQSTVPDVAASLDDAARLAALLDDEADLRGVER